MSVFVLTRQNPTNGTITARAFSSDGTAYDVAVAVSGTHPLFRVTRTALGVGATSTGYVEWYEDGSAISHEGFDALERGTDGANTATPDNAGIAAAKAAAEKVAQGYNADGTIGDESIENIATAVRGELNTGDTTGLGENLANAVEIKLSGGGLFPVPLTIKATDGTPLPECDVTITISDSAPNLGFVGHKVTDSNGEVKFYLNPGVYFVWRQKDGVRFTNPSQITVNLEGNVS